MVREILLAVGILVGTFAVGFALAYSTLYIFGF